MTISIEDFNRCCRCCLSMVETLQPIFGASLDEMLTKLTNLQITRNDGYPQQMCFQCILKLSSAYTFFQRVSNSHKTLEEILKASEKNGELSILGDTPDDKKLNTPEKIINSLGEVFYIQQFSHVQESSVKSGENSVSNALEEEGTRDSSEIEEQYQCLQCEHTSRDQAKLKVHLQTHVVGTQDQSSTDSDACMQLCNYCGARFKLRTSLHKHLRQHRGLHHQCGLCPKRFAEASCLRVHLVSHNLENPKPFQCGECQQSFGQKSSLKKHQQRHAARAQLHCTDCDKSFLHKYSLQKHRERHHLPAECPLCNKLFSGKKFLGVHMKSYKKVETSSVIIERLTDTVTEPINIQTVTVEFQCLLCTKKFQTRESLEVHICVRDEIT